MYVFGQSIRNVNRTPQNYFLAGVAAWSSARMPSVVKPTLLKNKFYQEGTFFQEL
jgi:hypothetical protein